MSFHTSRISPLFLLLFLLLPPEYHLVQVKLLREAFAAQEAGALGKDHLGFLKPEQIKCNWYYLF